PWSETGSLSAPASSISVLPSRTSKGSPLCSPGSAAKRIGRCGARTDGGHPMLFAATVRGRPLFNRRSRDQETRRLKKGDGPPDLMISCEFHEREWSEAPFLPSDLLIFCDPTRASR